MSKNYGDEIKKLIINTSKILGRPITGEDFYIEHQPCGHISKALPSGKMAIYTFVLNDEFLKIGKAGTKSKARYQSHHYCIKSNKSTLANSLVNDPNEPNITNDNVTQWIRNNCERFDVILDIKLGNMALSFIEGMLHFKYKPRYEGWIYLFFCKCDSAIKIPSLPYS